MVVYVYRRIGHAWLVILALYLLTLASRYVSRSRGDVEEKVRGRGVLCIYKASAVSCIGFELLLYDNLRVRMFVLFS